MWLIIHAGIKVKLSQTSTCMYACFVMTPSMSDSLGVFKCTDGLLTQVVKLSKTVYQIAHSWEWTTNVNNYHREITFHITTRFLTINDIYWREIRYQLLVHIIQYCRFWFRRWVIETAQENAIKRLIMLSYFAHHTWSCNWFTKLPVWNDPVSLNHMTILSICVVIKLSQHLIPWIRWHHCGLNFYELNCLGKWWYIYAIFDTETIRVVIFLLMEKDQFIMSSK